VTSYVSRRGLNSRTMARMEHEAQPALVLNLGGTWFSGDRLWRWDGTTWVPAEAGRRHRLPLELKLARAALIGQSGITGFTGLGAIGLGGLVGVTGGRQWLLLALAMFGGGVGLVTLAALLWWLRPHLGTRWDMWKATALVIEAALIPLGMWLLSFPQSTDTHGPFADGGEGAIGLLGLAYSGGAVVILLVLLHGARRGILDSMHGSRQDMET
jgi:hypothetical protein